MQRVVNVFVACPRELEAERHVLGEVVLELNNTWADFFGLRLALLHWLSHAWPAVGTDGQDVVNRQIGDNYEIFLGFVGSGLGTPTPRADSGTAEELDRALARHERDLGSVSIMFYFKAVPAAEDAVRVFRERIRGRGVLDWTFADGSEFEQLVRIHLSRQIQVFVRRDRTLEESEQKLTTPLESSRTDLAAQINTWAAEIELSTEEYVARAGDFTAALDDLTLHTNTAAADLRKTSRPGFRPRPGGRPAVIREYAARITEDSERLLRVGTDVVSIYIRAIRSFSRVVAVVAPIGPLSDGLRSTLSSSRSRAPMLADRLSTLRNANARLRTSIASVPSTPEVPEYAPARRRLLGVLDTLDAEFSKGLYITRELSHAVEAVFEP